MKQKANELVVIERLVSSAAKLREPLPAMVSRGYNVVRTPLLAGVSSTSYRINKERATESLRARRGGRGGVGHGSRGDSGSAQQSPGRSTFCCPGSLAKSFE